MSRIDAACAWRAPLTGNVTGYTRFLATTGDTVVIRADGAERLTYYPRDLESMIVRV